MQAGYYYSFVSELTWILYSMGGVFPGLAEHIDKAFRDLGEMSVLGKDCSTGIPSMLAVSSLGIISSRTGNIRRTPARAQSVSKVNDGYDGLR